MDYSYAIRVAANKYPKRTAVLYKDTRITFEELDRRIDRLAGGLLDIGMAGTRVASILLNEPMTIYLYMALARIGAVSVPLNVRLKEREKEYIVQNSEATKLVVDNEYLSEAFHLRDHIPNLNALMVVNAKGVNDSTLMPLEQIVDRGSSEEVTTDVKGDDPAMIMYTSGTTGFPKGVVRTHGANLWNVANSALGSPRNPEDIELFTLPIFGIGFIHFAMPTLLAGATLALDRSFHPKRTWELIEKHRITRTFLAPTMVDSMLSVPENKTYDISSLEIIYSAYEFAEKLRDRALERFGNRFVYMYGLTEAQLTCARPGEFANNPTSAGKAMGMMRVRILNDKGVPLGAGQIGEIALEGPSIMSGYYHLPEATKESLRNGWVLTGDLGYLDEEQNIHFSGRKKELIKTGGFNVDPIELENKLLKLEALREAAVVGVPDEHWGEMVVAFVAKNAEAKLSEEEIIHFCKKEVADYKVPKRIIFVEELPKNPTGKVERGRLRTLWKEEHS